MSVSAFFISLGVALVAGILFATMCFYKTRSSKSFLMTTSLLPATVALVIALVNGSVGIGIAIAGAFSLVRFRSAPGTAKEICIIFISMASGLAFGIGYLAYGVIFLLVAGIFVMFFSKFNVWSKKPNIKERMVKITLPENLDYTTVFDEVFKKYTLKADLVSVKTVNLGSMFRIVYSVVLKDPSKEKEFFDQLRVLNGNLEISSERVDLLNNDL